MAVTGGDKLERRLAEIAAQLGAGKTLRVGFLEGATYPDGEPVATIAAANEFGRPESNQPPRPFFRNAIADNRERWAKGFGVLLQQGRPVDQALALTGEVIRSDIQGSIRKLTDPPLADYTVAKKGFDKPLIDTSHMLNSVDYEVRDESA